MAVVPTKPGLSGGTSVNQIALPRKAIRGAQEDGLQGLRLPQTKPGRRPFRATQHMHECKIVLLIDQNAVLCLCGRNPFNDGQAMPYQSPPRR